MISIIALKLFLIHMSLLCSFILDEDNNISHVTSNLFNVAHVTQVRKIQIKSPYYIASVEVLSNYSHNYAVHTLAAGVGACDMFRYVATQMPYISRDQFETKYLRIHFDSDLISGVLRFKHFDPTEDGAMYSLAIANTWDWGFIERSFPTWLLNESILMVFYEQCEGCHSHPQWGTYFGT